MNSGLSPCKKIVENISSNEIPREAQSQYRQASKLFDQGRTEDALHCFKQAVEIAPNYTEALHETGNCLQNLGRCEEASVYYSRALKEIADRLCEIGKFEESKGQYWVAIRRYEEAGEFYEREASPARLLTADAQRKIRIANMVDPVDKEVP